MSLRSRVVAALLAIVLGAVVASPSSAQVPGGKATGGNVPGAKPNVLFVVVDDLNDWVGYLGGHPQSVTPNLDALAQRGVRFTHAYAAVTVCNPSRAAFLSGMRASTTGVYDNTIDWRPIIPEDKMITAQFRKAGYWVGGTGKVSHYLRQSDWDEFFKSKDGFQRRSGDTMHSSSINDVDDDAMLDHRDVSWAIEQLGKSRDRPFFLAVGLTKPHLPWNVPRKYYDRFPVESIQLPPYRKDDLDDVPAEGQRLARLPKHPGSDASDHEQIVRAGRWKETIQGYLAAIAFMDGQVGRLVEALDASAHRDNTIVVFFSDHGWHLGEKDHWRKQTLWEESDRVPYFWVAPGVAKPGASSDRVVDLMSLYPTLLDLAGLPIPDHVEGESIRTLLTDPEAPWEHPALTTYLFKNHSVRTETWRYIRYHDGGEELYDEEKDPQEWTNLAGKPELAAVKKKLAAYLPKTDAPPGPKMSGAADD